MPTETPRILLDLRYYEWEQEYLRSLPPEHFMEATPQATQRKITLESFDLIAAARPEIQLFNELLVQYPLKGKERPGQVVPDNMVVVYDGEIKAHGSFNLPLQPVRPYMMLEYVSKSNKRKDYDDNMQKYEHELKVPYYLLFQPDVEELTVYRYNGRKYVSVKPNEQERLPIPELELEVALHEGWVRYWFRGELLPLPCDLLKERDEERRRADEEQRRAEAAEAEVARLRAELERMRPQRPKNGR